MGGHRDHRSGIDLTERQATVLRALVAAYIGEGGPVGSRTLSHLIPLSLSSASVRHTMSELMGLGLVEQPHRSAGRVPTELGLRLFVDQLLARHGLGLYERRDLAASLEAAGPQAVIRAASELLSERTHQLGFGVRPRLDRVRLRHMTLVRLSAERVLAVLVAQSGVTHELVLEDADSGGQAELDRIARTLNELGEGCTLGEIRARLAREASELRLRAARVVQRTLQLAWHSGLEDELVIATRRALLEQPEFRNPQLVGHLLETLEDRDALVAVLDKLITAPGVKVTFGSEIDEPDLGHLALVAAPYGGRSRPLGVVGVIGPSRMDYARVIPMVEYVSQLLTERLCA